MVEMVRGMVNPHQIWKDAGLIRELSGILVSMEQELAKNNIPEPLAAQMVADALLEYAGKRYRILTGKLMQQIGLFTDVRDLPDDMTKQ